MVMSSMISADAALLLKILLAFFGIAVAWVIIRNRSNGRGPWQK